WGGYPERYPSRAYAWPDSWDRRPYARWTGRAYRRADGYYGDYRSFRPYAPERWHSYRDGRSWASYGNRFAGDRFRRSPDYGAYPPRWREGPAYPLPRRVY